MKLISSHTTYHKPQSGTSSSHSRNTGRLVVRDTFESLQPNQTTHGDRVILSSRSQGFQGEILTDQRTRAQMLKEPSYQVTLGAKNALFGRELSPELAKRALSDMVSGSAVALLNIETDALDRQTDKGLTRTVYNTSTGTTATGEAFRLYQDLGQAWAGKASPKKRDGAAQALQNLAPAFDLDFGKLNDSNPRVHGPERQKLQQSLLDWSHSTLSNNQGVADAKQDWTDAVQDFEALDNIVVISAGNEGVHDSALSRQNYRLPVKLPVGSTVSVLENEGVTSVGGVVRDAESEKTVFYAPTSRSEGIDILADALYPAEGKHGTSYAAPRVSAEYAMVLASRPDLSSRQVESLLTQHSSTKLQVEGRGAIPVLAPPSDLSDER